MSRFKNWLPPYFDKQNYAWNRVEAPYIGQSYMRGKICYGWHCLFPNKLILNHGCDIAHGSFLQAKHGIEIGKDVELGPFCYISSWSTVDNKQGKVIIKDGAKLGARVTVMPRITIGKNSIVGAHSFVNKDIPDNVIAFGTPCKVQKDLFKDAQLKNTLKDGSISESDYTKLK